MLRITNKSFGPLCFREKPSEDEPAGKIVEILPGETKPVETTRENVNVASYLSTQLIAVADDEIDGNSAVTEIGTSAGPVGAITSGATGVLGGALGGRNRSRSDAATVTEGEQPAV